MPNYVLVTDGTSPFEVEKKLRKFLPGLDVRLTAFGARQAILREPLVNSMQMEYPNSVGSILKAMGVVEIRAVTDEETLAVVAHRDIEALPDKPKAAAPAVDGFDWHLGSIRVPDVWKSLGGPHNIDWGRTRVALIDTGYTKHPALGFPIGTWVDVANAQTFMPPEPSGDSSLASAELGNGQDNLIGVNAGHGTRMGCTISGYAPNAPNRPYFGVAPKVPLHPIRITDVVWINHAQREFAQALDLAVAKGAEVVNVSLGVFGARVDDELRAALTRAYDAGVIVVCAAGNIVNPVVAPADLKRTVAVGGVTRENKFWSGSSYGPEVDFSAPSADLRRADVSRKKFSYGTGGDGTSYATAQTTGAAALWLTSRRADLDAAYSEPWQRVAAFTQLARTTARVPKVWNDGSFGTGVLDVAALVAAPLPTPNLLVKDGAA